MNWTWNIPRRLCAHLCGPLHGQENQAQIIKWKVCGGKTKKITQRFKKQLKSKIRFGLPAEAKTNVQLWLI